MTPRDPFETWLAERRSGAVPEGFSDRVMNAVRARHPRTLAGRVTSDRRVASVTFSVLTLAASALVVLAFQAAFVGGILLALTGTAH